MGGLLRKWLYGLLVFAGLLLLLIGFAPLLVEQFVLPQFLTKAGFGDHKISLSRLGPGGCTLHIGGRPQSSPVITGNINIDWTLSGLYRKRIDKITGNDLHINLVNLSARQKVPPEQPGKNRGKTKQVRLPILVRQVEIQHGSLVMQTGRQMIYLPFTFSGQNIDDQESKEIPGSYTFTVEVGTTGTQINGDLTLHAAAFWKLTGTVKGNIDLSELPLRNNGFNQAGIVMLASDFTLQLSPFTVEKLQASLHSQELLFTGKNFTLQSNGTLPAVISFAGANSNYILKGSGFYLTSPFPTPFDFDTEITQNEDDFDWQGTVQFNPDAGPLPFGGLSLSSFKALQISHTGRIAGNTIASLHGNIVVDDVDIALPKHSLEMSGINLDLSVVWPLPDDPAPGHVAIKGIRFKGKDTASMTADVIQRGEQIEFNGAVSSRLLPDQNITLSGSLRMPENRQSSFMQVAYSLNNSALDIAKLAPLLPALWGVTGNGEIDFKGHFKASQCGFSGESKIAVQDLDLTLKDTNTTLEDIDLRVYFPHLPSLTSTPQQTLSIGTIRKKNLLIHDLKTSFAIESPTSLFIEKIAGKWSGGRVFTSSFRVQRGQNDVDIALLCDRLELATILSQFGLAEAGGEGRLSGRIPIAYSDGNFFVDDGFLYSSPGEKGTLRIKKSKYLETTIPEDVPHFSPLHFAGAALADFEYNWAKLQVKSEEQNLLLKLQVDGKPREKLPFRFDREKNVFVRLPKGQKGGIDQPIKLDVNFNVPLNELFRYRKKIMPLMKQFN